MAGRLSSTAPKEARLLLAMVEELRRRPALRKAEPSSQSMTPALKRRIRIYAMTHDEMSFQEIAVHFNVNAGRVSEALNGQRK